MPEADVLSRVVSVFDEIYDGVTADFGNENSPGIDMDQKLHVLHASPQTICGVPANGEGGCGTAGFVSSPDLQPALLNPQSNERREEVDHVGILGRIPPLDLVVLSSQRGRVAVGMVVAVMNAQELLPHPEHRDPE